jgi:hypothetical protein
MEEMRVIPQTFKHILVATLLDRMEADTDLQHEKLREKSARRIDDILATSRKTRIKVERKSPRLKRVK